MPTFDPDLAGVLRSLQRQIDQINTSPPGPVSYGPGDHARFYGADGTTVLFEAVGGAGASVVSRGSLTSMTGLFDGIQDKDDAQDGVLSDHRGWIVGHGERLDGHDSTLSSHNTRITTAQSRADSAYGYADTVYSAVLKRATNDRVDGVLGVAQAAQARADDAHGDAAAAQSTATDANTRAVNAQSRADDAHGDAAAAQSTATDANTRAVNAQSRADSAYSRAGTGISNAATAQDRADAAYALAATRAAASTVSDLDAYMRAQVARLDARINNLPGS